MNKTTKNETISSIGYEIKKRRQAIGLSLREVSQKSGISITLISQLENGLRENIPKIKTLAALEKALLIENSSLQNIANGENNNLKNTNWEEELKTLLRKSLSMDEALCHEFIDYTNKIKSSQEYSIEASQQEELRLFLATKLDLDALTISHLLHFAQGLLLKKWAQENI